MSDDLKCPICGNPTLVYMGNAQRFGLCRTHNKELKDGAIIFCEECGKFHTPGQCEQKTSNPSTKEDSTFSPTPAIKKCIVCGEDSPNGDLCKECYSLMCDYKIFFDRNKSAADLREYYNNLLDSIYRMRSEHYIFSNCVKLYALASMYRSFYDEYLADRVKNDILRIIERKNSRAALQSPKVIAAAQERDSKLEREVVSEDGHTVKSYPESVIDNILYSKRIVHAYDAYVLLGSDERNMKCDWFIPVLNGEGIYIEYWGMNTPRYSKNKDKKITLYHAHNLPLISIDRDEYSDSRNLSIRLCREINRLAKEYYKVEQLIK